MSSMLHWVGNMSPESFLLLSILCFLAAFIDSIAGGGGMISLPAFMAVGLPPHIALGTNKVSAAIGTLASSLNFLRSNKIIIPLVTRFAPLALIGAIFGVKTALLIPPNYFQPISFFS
ncbi:Sulfite exporter TauE/SafE [Fusobacterium necrophorum subsp. necrophorum]|nr:Sulfite exporter TauE/SafE [Fusobacterium necrophorum subsp. necrophorum]